jgi:type IV pilus assembly protein PilA
MENLFGLALIMLQFLWIFADPKEGLMTKKGFTLIELLIVVAIIGIIAAIAIPNLLVSLQKGKQKATMSDMKTLGTAVESYITDWSYVPQINTIGELREPANGLVPFHTKFFPITDAWGTLFIYEHGTAGTEDAEFYSFQSYGRDKIVGAPVYGTFYECTSINDFNNDIVYSNGGFSYGPRTKK